MNKIETIEEIEKLSGEINKLGLELRFNVGVQLLNTGWVLDKALDIEARKLNHSRNRYTILYALTVHGGVMKATDLSNLLFKSKQTITQVIDGLEKEGLVTRKSKNKDRRIKNIFITPKGIEDVRNSLPYTLKAYTAVLPALTGEESKILMYLLRKIRRHIVSKLRA